jgi:hypothetical protein
MHKIMTHKLQRATKLFLSAFICLQLLTIFICPNPDSIIFRAFYSSIVVYGNLFGLNTTWRFFSPDPSVRLFEYDAFSRDSDGKLHGESYRYPKTLAEEPSREIFNRKMNNEMYVVARSMVDKTLGPLLCRRHPEAETLAVFMKGRNFPTIEKSVFQGSHIDDIGEITRDYLMDVNCHDISD